MKRLFLLLAIFSFVFTACEGGGDVEEENGGTPFIPEISYSPKSLEFKSYGEEKEVVIVANFEYEVTENVDWIDIEIIETGINVITKRNEDTIERNANIIISNDKYNITEIIAVKQSAYVPKIELSRQSVEVTFESAEYSVSVTSPYSWAATSKNDWIIVENQTGIAGTKELIFLVKHNEIEKNREGTIVIKNEDYNLVAELYVIQKAFEPTIVIEPEILAFEMEGGEQEVKITANFEYEVSASVEWLSCAKNENGIIVTAPNYVEMEDRTAEIVISCEKYSISKSIKVLQSAFEPIIAIEPETLAFEMEGGEQEVKIIANFEYEVSASAEWLSFTKNDNGIIVIVPNYEGVENRTTEVVVSSEKYSISKIIQIKQYGLSKSRAILYTSTDGKIVEPYIISASGQRIVSNTYENGRGIIIFSDDVTYIGDWAFSGCTSLTSITIPDSVTSIGKYAFDSCTLLTSITIPDSVTEIGNAAFCDCNRLKSVTISDSVTSIGWNVFSYGGSLTRLSIENVYVNITDLAKYTTGNPIAALIIEGDRHLLVNGVEISELVIPDGVTSIGGGAFNKCSSLTSVKIPNSVVSIGNTPFLDCTSLTAFYGKYASEDNRCLIVDGVLNSFAPAGLTKYTIPDSVTSINHGVFYDCTSLTNVTIPDSVTSIGDETFYGCTSLTSVTIPDRVTSIGFIAFCECTSLKEIYCKPITPPIFRGGDIFADIVSWRKFYVPRNSVEAYKAADGWSVYASDIVGYDF